MCFVSSWQTELVAMWMTLVLSVWRNIGQFWGKPSLANNLGSQTISEHAVNVAWYYDLVEGLETWSCFLLFQDVNE